MIIICLSCMVCSGQAEQGAMTSQLTLSIPAWVPEVSIMK